MSFDKKAEIYIVRGVEIFENTNRRLKAPTENVVKMHESSRKRKFHGKLWGALCGLSA